MLLDEDSSHIAGSSQRLAETWNMEFLWLPYRSPKLNPMDHFWRHGKEVISSNHQYPSIEEHVKRFIRYLAAMPPRQALVKAGALSKRFWLKRYV
jgi:hypothetical protein